MSEELIDNELLEIYEYSNSRISKIESNRQAMSISFSTETLNSEFLIIGMRQTYSKGDNWKIGIIALVVLVFFGCMACIKKISIKHKFD